MITNPINAPVPMLIRSHNNKGGAEQTYLRHPIVMDLLRSTEILPALLKSFLTGTAMVGTPC